MPWLKIVRYIDLIKIRKQKYFFLGSSFGSKEWQEEAYYVWLNLISSFYT